MIHIVLYQPRIPQNTGTIGRLCYCFGIPLHLVHPLGYKITDKAIKRAGLDYWQDLRLFEHTSYEAFMDYFSAHKKKRPSLLYYISTKASTPYYEARLFCDSRAGEEVDKEAGERADKKIGKEIEGDLFLIFGREDRGFLGIDLDAIDTKYTIPMQEYARSLNLACAVAIVASHFIRLLGLGEQR